MKFIRDYFIAFDCGSPNVKNTVSMVNPNDLLTTRSGSSPIGKAVLRWRKELGLRVVDITADWVMRDYMHSQDKYL